MKVKFNNMDTDLIEKSKNETFDDLCEKENLQRKYLTYKGKKV